MCGRPEIVFFKIDPVRTNSSRREKPWFWITQVDISIENGTTKILERSSCARSHVYPADCTGNSTNRDGFRKVAICYYAFLAVARLDSHETCRSPGVSGWRRRQRRTRLGILQRRGRRPEIFLKDDTTCTDSDDPVVTGVIDAFWSPPILQRTVVVCSHSCCHICFFFYNSHCVLQFYFGR